MKNGKAENLRHWLKGLSAICDAPGTITITFAPSQVTCPRCMELMKDEQLKPDKDPPD